MAGGYRLVVRYKNKVTMHTALFHLAYAVIVLRKCMGCETNSRVASRKYHSQSKRLPPGSREPMVVQVI